MNVFTRLAAAAVFGLLAVAVFVYLSRPPLPVGGTPTPNSTASPNLGVAIPPSPTNLVQSAEPTASSAPNTPLIAYIRQTDKLLTEVGDSSLSCRYLEGQTCRVDRVWVTGIDGTGAHELVPDGAEALQLLGWSGYTSPPDGALQFAQADSALHMIRLLVSPIGAIILCGTIILAWLFPLTREKYARIQRLLEQRRGRLAE